MENSSKNEVTQKRKRKMYQTFKINLFREPLAFKEANGFIFIEPDNCDLRPLHNRFDKQTRILTASSVDNVLTSESILTSQYGKENNGELTLFDFISVDCSVGNDNDENVIRVKDMLCRNGIALPVSQLSKVGYIPHDKVDELIIESERYVIYRVAMQSANENRQCKVTCSTYPWEAFAKSISSNARYLSNATQTPQKALSRQGLAKTGGTIIKDFSFSYVLMPDYITDITFKTRCFYDKDNVIKEEAIQTKKTATDGHGWIAPDKAKELADKLGLKYIPSAFQVRFGQVKGLLLVFDFLKYCEGRIKEDIIFTNSMWKEDFNTSTAEFLVANVSKQQRNYTEWNYQMFCCLNNQLEYLDVLPHVQKIKTLLFRALESPEDALNFLGALSDLNVNENTFEEYTCVDKVSAVIKSNPKLAMNLRWVRRSIKRKIDTVVQKMLSGRIPMPGSISILGTDPLAYFNALKVSDGKYSFNEGEYVVPLHKREKGLSSGEFYYDGYEGDLLAMRTPLTHWAQIRKMRCVSNKQKSYWYRHLNQLLIFNDYDETVLGMSGGDYDGDFAFVTKLFVDRFNQADYIIYNNNNVSGVQSKYVLTEDIMRQTIRSNLNKNMLGIIVNLNSRTQELLNDEKTLQRFINLANYKDNQSFSISKLPKMPYMERFCDMDTAKRYLQDLNHILTTLSELEVDKPKTGYHNRFNQYYRNYALPFFPKWFSDIKNSLDYFYALKPEELSVNNFGEKVRKISKNYHNKVVKVIEDTLKNGQYGVYVQRIIEMMADNDSIMGNLHRFIQDEIINAKIDYDTCYNILESLSMATNLNHDEAQRIYLDVLKWNGFYYSGVSAYVKALKDGVITEEEFNDSFDSLVWHISEELRALSSDRNAIAYSAYKASLENPKSSESFVFMIALDGITALLDNINDVQFYEIKLRRDIPEEATHLIVYRNKFRLPEVIDPSKTYFGVADLPNGSYEIHRNIKSMTSLIIPKAISLDKLNPFPCNTEFSLKVSYKTSELPEHHKNGEYVSSLMARTPVTFKQTTIDSNIQYCVYAGDTWVGTIFNDQSNRWVQQKDIVRHLMSNQYKFVEIPMVSKGRRITSMQALNLVDSNSTMISSSGKPRSAQIITFAQA